MYITIPHKKNEGCPETELATLHFYIYNVKILKSKVARFLDHICTLNSNNETDLFLDYLYLTFI